MNIPMYDDCPFCGVDDPKFRAKQENTVFLETENFVVTPTRGSFVEGYLLIVTKEHFLSFGRLPDHLFAEFRQIHRTVTERLRPVYGPIITFEHGGNGGFADRGGSCIEHAHMHIVPYSDNPWQLVESDYLWTSVRPQTWPQDLGENAGYIYLESNHGSTRLYYARPDFPRQYLRRRLCLHIGDEFRDKWHYDLYPFDEKIAKTVAKVNHSLSAPGCSA